MSIAYKYEVTNTEDNIMVEVLVIADNEKEAEDKLISEHKKHGINIDFNLEDEDYYDLVIS